MRLIGVSRAVGLRLARELPAGAGGVPLLQRGGPRVPRHGARAGAASRARHGWVDFAGARRFGQTAERLRLLALALLVMDVGTVTLPADVLAKPGPLDDRERALVRTHPERGAALLASPRISPRVVGVVRVVAAVDPYEPHRLTVRVAEAGGPAEVTVDSRDDAMERGLG